MRNERSSVDGERGASLIEALVAVGLLGFIVVGVLGAMGTSIRTSDYHRKRTEVESVLVSAAERIKETGLEPCAQTDNDTYLEAAREVTEAEGWPDASVKIVSITYWNGSAYTGSCNDLISALKLQRIKIEVRHLSGSVHQDLEFDKGERDRNDP